jgi:hypothetical protein
MSFDPLIQAIQDNPELVEELNAAKTPRERDAILDAHGIEKPTMDSEFPDPAAGNIDPLNFSLELPSKQSHRVRPQPFIKKPS